MANVELLKRTLQHIEDHPENWNQGLWITLPEEREPGRCGTAYCFAGWTVMLSGHEIDADGYVPFETLPDEVRARIDPFDVGQHSDADFVGNRTSVGVAEAAAALLDIEDFWRAPGPHLFDGSNDLEDLRQHVAGLCGETAGAAR